MVGTGKIKVNCLTCNKEFYTTEKIILSGNGKYCSRKCYGKSKLVPRVTKICPECGNEFILYASEEKGKWNRKYCSDKCKYKNWSGEKSPFQRKRTSVTCSVCNKEFLISEWLSTKIKHYYCSKECKQLDKHPICICENCGKEFITDKWKPKKFCTINCYKEYIELPIVIKNCLYCNIEFKTNRQESKFCSYKCAYDYHVGAGNPNWKGGTTNDLYCWKFNERAKELIRNKFNRKCVICGKSEQENNNKHLAVHHIDYNKNSICNGKSWALIPLCSYHHGKTNGSRYKWFNILMGYWIYKNDFIFDDTITKFSIYHIID